MLIYCDQKYICYMHSLRAIILEEKKELLTLRWWDDFCNRVGNMPHPKELLR